MKSQFFPNSRLLRGCRQSGSGVGGGWVVRRFWKIPTKLLGGTRRFQVGSKNWGEGDEGSRKSCGKVDEVPTVQSILYPMLSLLGNSTWASLFFWFQKRIARGTRRLVCQAISVHQNAGKRHVIFHKLRGFRSAADSKLEALPRISVFFQEMLFVGCYLSTEWWFVFHILREKKYVPCAERSEFARFLDILM